MKRILRAMMFLPVFWVMTAQANNLHFDAMSDLPPGEQYRQLSLMLLVAAGVNPRLREQLQTGSGSNERPFNPDDYTTPLARIVDPGSLMTGAAYLFQFSYDNQEAIRARMEELEIGNPVLISMLDQAAITEDTIIIRNAIADSIDYAQWPEEAEMEALVQDYRVKTLYLRNVMEFDSFEAELQRLTDNAIASVGGKLDAYNRMFEDETGYSTFDNHIDAAERIYNKDNEFDPEAARLTDEIIENMQLMESQPNR